MFLQICLRVPGYPKISNSGYPVPEKNENSQVTINLPLLVVLGIHMSLCWAHIQDSIC